MGSDPKKRQKKLERKSAKRKDKRHQLVREKNAGLGDRLTAAAKFPVLDCWITDSLYEEGLGWVVLSREIPNGTVAVVNFLVDRYCLGVKNLHAEIVGRATYDEKYRRKMLSEMQPHDVSPADALKLVQEAVAYARGLGFSPHADYTKALHLFGSTDATASTAQYEFGKDGQPFFMNGPNDTPQRCKQIMATLTNTCGPGNFNFIIGGPNPSLLGRVFDESETDAEGFNEDENEEDE